MRLIAIGDIHGCASTLERLLSDLQLQQGDHLVFLGDYIDRGPDSAGVIEQMLRLRKAPSLTCTFIRGNHDQMMLDYLDTGEMELWQHNGGIETLKSYRQGTDVVIPPEHIDFLRSTVMFFDSDNYFFVHAGARPDQSVAWNVEHGSASVFLWSREHLHTSATEWEKTVVCGHTPIPHPILRPDLIAIDTGCVFAGRTGLGLLTAIDLPSRALTQTPYVG